jgi:hypothetical protein
MICRYQAENGTNHIWSIPHPILLEDQKTGLIIYGKETDKPMNISTTGFGSRFSKVFILCFFAVGFLMGIAPIVLDILGMESFTIGPTNSIFTIFEFHSSDKGWGAKFFPMSLLAISVIAGLVYAIIQPGNPKKKDVT